MLNNKKRELERMGSFNFYSGINSDLVLNSEQVLLSQVVENRNIRWLCHFTPRENLENIKKNGLKTRDLLFSWENTFTDLSRFDQYRNAICLSISKPNKWMFNRKVEQGFDLCLLLISPEILYRKNCLFYPHNAATASYKNIDIKQIKGELALEKMFADSVSFQKSQCFPSTIERHSFLENCETTSDQAEVQCLENIEPEFIIHIFEDNIPLTYEDIKNDSAIYNQDSDFILEHDFSDISLDLDWDKFNGSASLLENVENVENVENITDNNKNKPKKSLRELSEETLAALETIPNGTLSSYLPDWSEFKESNIIRSGIHNDVDCDWAISHARKLLSDVRELSDDVERDKRLERVKLINDAVIKYQNKCLKKLGLPTISEDSSGMSPCKSVGREVNISRSDISSSSGDGCLGFVILIIILIFMFIL